MAPPPPSPGSNAKNVHGTILGQFKTTGSDKLDKRTIYNAGYITQLIMSVRELKSSLIEALWQFVGRNMM